MSWQGKNVAFCVCVFVSFLLCAFALVWVLIRLSPTFFLHIQITHFSSSDCGSMGQKCSSCARCMSNERNRHEKERKTKNLQKNEKQIEKKKNQKRNRRAAEEREKYFRIRAAVTPAALALEEKRKTRKKRVAILFKQNQKPRLRCLWTNFLFLR